VARLGILKIARYTNALGSFPETRIWDEPLAQQAAASARDAAAHIDAIAPLSS